VERNRNITLQGTKENNIRDDLLRGLPGKPPGSPLFFLSGWKRLGKLREERLIPRLREISNKTSFEDNTKNQLGHLRGNEKGKASFSWAFPLGQATRIERGHLDPPLSSGASAPKPLNKGGTLLYFP
jgi:hypothetical protein